VGEYLKEFSAALPAATQCVQLAPNDALSWHLLGWVQFNLRNDEAALAAFERSLAINPSNAAELRNKAVALRRLGHRKESRAVLAEAARLDPKGYRQWRRQKWRNWWRTRFVRSWRILVVILVILLINAYFYVGSRNIP
jgi:tetratricopeptide (TPR) repeat protein